MRPDLYFLSESFRRIAALVTAMPEDGEVPVDWVAEIDRLSLDLPDRVGQSLSLRDMLRDEAETYRGRAAKFTEMARRRESVADTITADVIRAMDAAKTDTLPTVAGKVRVSDGPFKLEEIREPADLPEQFRRVKVEANRIAAAKYLKETGNVPDGFVASRGRTLKVT